MTAHPAIAVLRQRDRFWAAVSQDRRPGGLAISLIPFIVLCGGLYGAVLAGWRSGLLALYVAVKLPILLIGTSSLVMLLNWMTAGLLGSGLSLRQVIAITYGAMGVACWILLSLTPVTLVFTLSAAPSAGAPADLRLAHNCLLLTHVALIACAGVAGNSALRQGLSRIVAPRCSARAVYWSWMAAFALVGCQLSWILRPFVGSPFYPVVFLRPDALNRNFIEFVFGEVLPNVLKGGT